jgi:dinuclear metal center YbgI/SA1388 family protein
VPRLEEIVHFLDATLRTAEIPDYDGALNGLQFANRGTVEKVAGAVDFSSRSVDSAVAAGADMLLVHHGMFWGRPQPIRGPRYTQIATLVTHNVAVYASHLPLDVHGTLGNNVLLARTLGLVPTHGFARFHTIEVGLSGTSDIETADLVARATRFSLGHGGRVVTTPFAAGRLTRSWAVCTGAGADSDTLREAAERGIDTMIVGEGPHHTAVEAANLGIVVIYAGHYATETLGVAALVLETGLHFGIDATFIDAPTGL